MAQFSKKSIAKHYRPVLEARAQQSYLEDIFDQEK